MEDKINLIDINEKLDHEEIYNLFKTRSSKTNKEISEKISIFKYNIDFLKFYSSKDFKNLLNIFELKISENNDESFSSFESDTEQYISCISQIILSLKLFLKIQDILAKLIINAKNHLSKLKYENKIENNNQDYLFLYSESLLKISSKNLNFHPSDSTLFTSNFSSFDDTPKNSLFRQVSSEYIINRFASGGIESIYNIPTPKFEFGYGVEFENQENKKPNLENFHIKNNSILTFSEYIFDEGSFISKNLEQTLIKSTTAKLKIRYNSVKRRNSQIENVINKHKNKRNTSSEICPVTNNKKNHYRNLLEMTNKIYKKGFINSEEKVKFKKLILEKSKKIEYFYNIYKNSENDKNILVAEIKKLIN